MNVSMQYLPCFDTKFFTNLLKIMFLSIIVYVQKPVDISRFKIYQWMHPPVFFFFLSFLFQITY